MFYKHRRDTRNLLQSFRTVGARFISARLEAVVKEEEVPNDLLTAMVRAHCKL